MDYDELLECWSVLYPGLGNAKDLGKELLQEFQPIAVLKPRINRVVNFGYWHCDYGIDSNEPYALAWTLDASEVVVVEKNEKFVQSGQEILERLRIHVPTCLKSHLIRFILSDMTETIPELCQNYFDVSFCRRVLLQVYEEYGQQGLIEAITQIVRIVRPGGWVIACEQPNGYLPKNTDCFFEEAGLIINKSIDRFGILKDAYIYNKPL